MKIKICGLTRPEDVRLACDLGADACGFVLAPSSRQVAWDRLPELAREVTTSIISVAVMVDPSREEADRALKFVDRIQFHGQESPEFCARYGRRAWKAFRIRESSDLLQLRAYHDAVGGFLLDSYVAGVAGGTGKTFPWSLLDGHDFSRPVFLAGGLNSSNVADASQVASVRGLDVSSGIEAEPGRKCPDKMRQFFLAARPQS